VSIGANKVGHAQFENRADAESGRIAKRNCHNASLPYDGPMFPRHFTRQALTLALALGIMLSAAAPSLAVSLTLAKDSTPTEMAMPGMAMQGDCMEAMERGTPSKDMPRKNAGGACGLCIGCGLPVLLQASLAELLYGSSQAVFTHDVTRSSIAVLPALPPPIA